MTDRDLMHQALDALEKTKPKISQGSLDVLTHDAAITALRDRLAQSEQGPVAWQGVHDHTDLYYRKPPQADVRPLYINPRRQWVGLTPEERKECIDWATDLDGTEYSKYLAKMIEHKLKEKNGG